MTVRIIDSHQHLWDLSRLDLPWTAEIPELNRNFWLEDYRKATNAVEGGLQYEMTGTLYMEVDVTADQINRETDLILELCRDSGNLMQGMIAATRPGEPLFAKSVQKAEQHPEIRGFRRVLHTDEVPPGFCLSDRFAADLQELGRRSLSFDLCVRRDELMDICQLASRCPETSLVLDHCGNADVRMDQEEFARWEKGIRELARRENVVCKVSGFVWTIQEASWTHESHIEPILRVVFEAFGEQRVLFGGDWPVCTLSALSFPEWVSQLHRFARNWGTQTSEKLFLENARRVYRLESG